MAHTKGFSAVRKYCLRAAWYRRLKKDFTDIITIFACPKPFKEHIGIIQRNAIRSWTLLRPKPEIILFGDDEGTAEICQEMKLRHIPEICRNEFKTPLLNDILGKAQRMATFELLCYVNSDVIFMSDFIKAVEGIRLKHKKFMLAGAVKRLDITESLDFNNLDWEEGLRVAVKRTYKKLRPDYRLGADYFIFQRGFFTDIPPLALGRWAWDGWILWKARKQQSILIDITPVVLAIHQEHDYSLIQTDSAIPWQGEEARRNLQLAALRKYFFLYEATHCLTPLGLKRLWFQKLIFSLKDFLKNLLIYRLGPIRRKVGLCRTAFHRLGKLFNLSSK